MRVSGKESDPHCVAGVLVGGQSARMGQPKAVLPLADGRTLVEHVVSVAREPCAWLDELVILGRYADLPAAVAGLRVLEDALPCGGPLAGLCALLEYAGSRWGLLLACDLPRLQSSLLGRLHHALGPAHDAAAFRRLDQPAAYHACCALYHARLLPAALHELTRGKRSLQRLLMSARVAALDPSPAEQEMLTNLNTPTDYHRLGQRG